MKKIKITIVTVATLVALILLLLSLLGYMPIAGYTVDTCSQLRLLFFLSAFPFILVALILRSRVIASVAGMVLLANGNAFLPLLKPRHESDISAKLTLVTANVWGAHNKKADLFITFIHETQPDIICIQEDTPQWLLLLKKGLPEYHYSFDEGISGGSAIFSKIPIERVFPREGPYFRRYGVRGEIVLAGQKILVIAEHPPAPNNRTKWGLRNQELLRLSDDVRTSEIPVVIAGDLNSTPWSGYFQRFIQTAKLEDSEIGNGIQASWNTKMLLPLVPIDHCLFSKEFVAINRKTGPNVGSDHLPLVIELGVKVSGVTFLPRSDQCM